MCYFGVFAQVVVPSGSDFSAEKYATPKATRARELLSNLLPFLAQINQKLIGEVQKALERRLDDEIEKEHKYVDG